MQILFPHRDLGCLIALAEDHRLGPSTIVPEQLCEILALQRATALRNVASRHSLMMIEMTRLYECDGEQARRVWRCWVELRMMRCRH